MKGLRKHPHLPVATQDLAPIPAGATRTAAVTPACLGVFLLATLAAVGMTACTGTRAIVDPAPTPTAKHVAFAEKAGYPSTSLRALVQGRRLYLDKCSGCHGLYPATAYKAGKWPRIVRDMQASAGIDEDHVRDITRYLVAIAAAQEDTAAGTRTPSR